MHFGKVYMMQMVIKSLKMPWIFLTGAVLRSSVAFLAVDFRTFSVNFSRVLAQLDG